jgi:hydrogenase nickel incorporation protein HypA/HybF
MQELTLAASIADIAHRHARGRKVTRVGVAVGPLRQAAAAALSFGFELVTTGTPLEGAQLSIRQLPLLGRCRSCGREVEPESWPLACPACASFELSISGGNELFVEALDYEALGTEALAAKDGSITRTAAPLAPEEAEGDRATQPSLVGVGA